MVFYFLLFIILYTLLLWSMIRHWQLPISTLPEAESRSSKAILIPFRNEADHLPCLLNNLEKIASYPQPVIFIDDHSTDGSGALVSDFIARKGRTDWVSIKSEGVGKKAALATGVHYSQADIILTTDADCLLPVNWVREMPRAFERSGIQLVAGPVITASGNGFFSRFQQIEWGSILLLTNYLFSIGRPTMCSGANLAYRRAAFLAVDGYLGNEHYPSGDDEFLLKKIVNHFGHQAVSYIHHRESLVQTGPATSLGTFVQQRIRWAGKWRLHRSFGQAFTAALALIMALLQLGSLGLLLGPPKAVLAGLLFWVLKISMERHVLMRVLDTFLIRPRFYSFLASSFLHPLYVVLVGVLALRGKYLWKGRNQHFKS